ncbi:WhiB family transcriptional regulator [Nonomuraea sp. bgisy101]|uniref:WhiB family transcriptional regulator n=1 Tax=Nonomuraea sp. bgisy101 TaxID=3413784 RepID=UPI003D72D168
MRTDLMDSLAHAAARDDWMSWGLCSETDPDAFFPPEQAGPNWWAAAAAVCEDCPVRDECRDYAQEHAIEWGVWGGTTYHDRRLDSELAA